MAVLAFGRGGETQQKDAGGGGDDRAIGRRVGVVELVDDQVIPSTFGDLRAGGQGLDSREDEVGLGRALAAGRAIHQSGRGRRKDLLKGALGLA